MKKKKRTPEDLTVFEDDSGVYDEDSGLYLI